MMTAKKVFPAALVVAVLAGLAGAAVGFILGAAYFPTAHYDGWTAKAVAATGIFTLAGAALGGGAVAVPAGMARLYLRVSGK